MKSKSFGNSGLACTNCISPFSFLYMNDDYFIGRYTDPSAFFTVNKGPVLHLSPPGPLYLASQLKGKMTWSQSVRYTWAVLRKEYGFSAKDDLRLISKFA